MNRRWTSLILPLRIKGDDAQASSPAKGLHRRAAGIAGRGADNGQGPPSGDQSMLIEPRHDLHGDVLEGQRWAMEKLQDELAGPRLS